MYTDDELLMISGIQHFVFCQAQWSLIHIEQEWKENRLTAEGQVLHKNVDDPFLGYRRDDEVKIYAMPIVSYSLGIYGVADCIELTPMPEYAPGKPFRHPHYPGGWGVRPVEFKHGKPKEDNADRLQLAAQAACIEEMYGINVPSGSIFYAKTRHREEVKLDPALREELQTVCREMHQRMAEKRAVIGTYGTRCKSCSLLDLCMPKLGKKESVRMYIRRNIWNSKL